jgi:hypothetical protein
MRRYFFAFFLLLASMIVQGANASSVVSTSDVKLVSLGINDQGQAMVTYTQGSEKHHTLAYGAENALAPTPGARQVSFTYDYSGGYTLFKRDIATAVGQLRGDQALFHKAKEEAAIKKDNAAIQKLHTLANSFPTTFTCKPYTGPKLAFQVAACDAPDGSYWALQQWQRQLPDYDATPTGTQAANELHLAHWTGPLPVLSVETDWSYHKWEHLFGTYTYAGKPVFGFKSTSSGAPLDTFGRNVYLDSYDSDYTDGTGVWTRVNSWLTHTNTGAWCYGVSPHAPSGATGAGAQYRLTVEGPGVAPDVSVTVASPGAYNATLDAAQNAKIAALNDNLCKPN